MESRREFIKNICATTAALHLLPLTNHEDVSESHLYFSESNTFSGSSFPFTIGILKINAVSQHLSEIQAIRKKHHYRSPFKYRSTDKFKLPYAKDLIDYFTETKSISFFGRTVSGNIDSRSRNFLEIKTLSYYSNYRKALSDALSHNEVAKIYLGKHDDNLKSYLQKNVSKIQAIENSTDDLYQLSQFFAGSVSADQFSIKNKTKTGLIRYLKERMGVKESNKLYSSTNSRFRISSARI